MINQKTARNQILGAVVMGVGMGLLEETIYDPRNGNPINSNYADYMVVVNADIPELQCITRPECGSGKGRSWWRRSCHGWRDHG